MTDDRIPTEWVDALDDALGVFADLVRTGAVAERWTEPSVLEGYTVGGIAGHVLSLVTGLLARLESDPVDVEPLERWYGQAIAVPTRHDALMALGEELAAAGPTEIAAQVERAGRQLSQRAAATDPTTLIPLNSQPGKGVRFDEFFPSRFVEITVHAEDIAASVGIPLPAFPDQAWQLAASVLPDPGPDPRQAVLALRPPR